jgi:hypothetical protein
MIPSDEEKRRKFFDEFARSKKFNPLDADKWYFISKKEILMHPVC